VLYVWLRTGVAGALVLCSLLGFAVISGCRLLRAADPTLALFGAVAVCAVAAYAVLGYLDMGFFWFRVAVFTGGLLGILETARRAQASADGVALQPSGRAGSPVDPDPADAGG